MILIQLQQFYIVTNWAIIRKQRGKQFPKLSRIGAHCYAAVRVLWFTACSVTVESQYPWQ